jgi:hypothetical protein
MLSINSAEKAKSVFPGKISDDFPIKKKSLNGSIKLCFGTICKNSLNAL